MIKETLALIAVFILGIASANIYYTLASPEKNLQLPDQNSEGGFEYKDTNYLGKLIGGSEATEEQNSPRDRVSEEQILVTKDKVQINLKDATWATFTDTNSMDPIIDSGANAIEVTPNSEDEIQPGDIVAYESEYADGVIIHRVAYKGQDEKGTYFVMKGDNNPTSDPGRVRFSQIRKVVVAIIY